MVREATVPPMERPDAPKDGTSLKPPPPPPPPPKRNEARLDRRQPENE